MAVAHQAQTVARTTAAAAERRETLIRLPGFLDALRDGEAPDDGDRFSHDGLIAALGEEEGTNRWAEIEDARRFGRAMGRVKWAMPDEIADLLDREDASPPIKKLPFVMENPDGLSAVDVIRRLPFIQGRNGSADEWLLRLAVERRNEQLWSRPADYVLAPACR